jgi:hypothetical protein
MSKVRSSTKSNFRPSRFADNRQRIARSADAEERERMRLVLLNKMIERAKQPVIQI